MATSTTNYGWTKPSYEDDADIMVINGTIDAIDSQVKTNENNISSLTGASTSVSFSCTTAGVYEYTGISISVPANEAFEIIATDRFSSNAPQGVIIASTNQDSELGNDAVIIAESAEPLSTNKGMRTRTAIGVTSKLSTTSTYYVWVKRSGTSANTVIAYYRKLY